MNCLEASRITVNAAEEKNNIQIKFYCQGSSKYPELLLVFKYFSGSDAENTNLFNTTARRYSNTTVSSSFIDKTK